MVAQCWKYYVGLRGSEQRLFLACALREFILAHKTPEGEVNMISPLMNHFVKLDSYIHAYTHVYTHPIHAGPHM